MCSPRHNSERPTLKMEYKIIPKRQRFTGHTDMFEKLTHNVGPCFRLSLSFFSVYFMPTSFDIINRNN